MQIALINAVPMPPICGVGCTFLLIADLGKMVLAEGLSPAAMFSAGCARSESTPHCFAVQNRGSHPSANTIKMVLAEGFEPPTLWAETRYSIQLSHASDRY